MISLTDWRNYVALAFFILPATIAGARQAGTAPAAAPVPPHTVHVPYVRDPVDKSYAKMLKAMDLHARERALAPTSTLRFRLLPRLPDTSLDGVTLRIAGATLSLPVALAPDFSFTLPVDARAQREDAAVLANRRSDALTWRAWVATPGLAPGTRRLGDLRLECRVGVEAGLVSNRAPLFGWLAAVLDDSESICNRPDGNYLFFAERPLFGVTLRHGARRETLPLAMLYAGGDQTAATLPYCDCQVLLERSYYAPLWDRSWPDDTLLEFDFMEPP